VAPNNRYIIDVLGNAIHSGRSIDRSIKESKKYLKCQNIIYQHFFKWRNYNINTTLEFYRPVAINIISLILIIPVMAMYDYRCSPLRN